MKKRQHIILFFALILTGYGFQISRFHAAALQDIISHTHTKGLAKRIVAHVNPNSIEAKKLVFQKKSIKLNYNSPTFDQVSATLFIQTATRDYTQLHCSPHYLSPSFFFSGKRGPPSII